MGFKEIGSEVVDCNHVARDSGSGEHGDEPSGSIKAGECLDKLRN
jgi:hypothetical protein